MSNLATEGSNPRCHILTLSAFTNLWMILVKSASKRDYHAAKRKRFGEINVTNAFIHSLGVNRRPNINHSIPNFPRGPLKYDPVSLGSGISVPTTDDSYRMPSKFRASFSKHIRKFSPSSVGAACRRSKIYSVQRERTYGARLVISGALWLFVIH
jgi:hypothetical protein